MNEIISKEVNKRILFICSPFFGYYKHIINEMEEQGYVVDYYNDRPTENGIIKGLIKIKKNIVNIIINDYFHKILSETKTKNYEKVIIVNGKIFNCEMISLLKKQHKKSRFIYYTWDSIELYPNVKKFLYLFDKTYSFDKSDCDNIEKLELLPLFYTKSYEKVGCENMDKREIEYDILSICTVHPNRYEIINEIFPKLREHGCRIYSFMFLNKLQFLYNKIFVKEFKNSKIREFEFKSLDEKAVLDKIRKSKVIFDIPHSQQSGLTMRTIETLGAKRKLITTNKSIIKYDFYNKNNILILDNNTIKEINEFIESDYSPIKETIYEKYSLRSWVDTVLNERENCYIHFKG